MNIQKILNIDVNKKIYIQFNDEIRDMSMYEFTRWVCLLKGIDVIEDKAKQLNVNLNDNKDWIKPLALQKFVEEETLGMVILINNLRTKQYPTRSKLTTV